MANREILAAVSAEVQRLLFNREQVWSELREAVAEDLAPLIADVVRESLLRSLSEPEPDARLTRVKDAAKTMIEMHALKGRHPEEWPWLEEDVIRELTEAASALPDHVPASLAISSPDQHVYTRMKDACELAMSLVVLVEELQPLPDDLLKATGKTLRSALKLAAGI